jgi:hypothetical protein
MAVALVAKGAWFVTATKSEPTRVEPQTLAGEASPRSAELLVQVVRPRARRPLTIGLLGLLVVALFYVLFSAFVTNLWYQSRQRSMAAMSGSQLAPHIGDPVGVLQVDQTVPAVSMNVAVTEGDGSAQLHSGPGHRPGTPLPGRLGNSVIYGRANTWGGPFRGLGKLQVGGHIYVQSRAGFGSSLHPCPVETSCLDYTVVAVRDVSESQSVAFLGKSTDYRLTLITDTGGRFSSERRVVVAVSGPRGKLLPVSPHTTPGPSADSLFGLTLLETVGWVVAVAVVVILLRRRQSLPTVAAAVTPLILAVLVYGFLELSLLWSPLA